MPQESAALDHREFPSLRQMHLNKYGQLVEEENGAMDVDGQDNVSASRETRTPNAMPVFDGLMSIPSTLSYSLPGKQYELRLAHSHSKSYDFVTASSLVCRPTPASGNAFDQLMQAQARGSAAATLFGAGGEMSFFST